MFFYKMKITCYNIGISVKPAKLVIFTTATLLFFPMDKLIQKSLATIGASSVAATLSPLSDLRGIGIESKNHPPKLNRICIFQSLAIPNLSIPHTNRTFLSLNFKPYSSFKYSITFLSSVFLNLIHQL